MNLHSLHWWRLALLAFSQFAVAVMAQECAAPIVVKGKKFFNSATGEYFPVKGINYYPRPNAGELGEGGSRDYFTEEMRPIWERDVEHFKNLNVNVVRLYAVDPGADHDSFMCALQAAGIYVIVGLGATCENCAIITGEAPNCYPAELKTRGQLIINVFSKYDNVLAFDAGNEVNLVAPQGQPYVNAPCQKQFVRDMQAFVSGCNEFGMRQIPVGIASADSERDENALYYGCQTVPGDDLEPVQWYGLNTYVHCDGSATSIDQLVGYQQLLSDFGSYGLSYPIMLTEFGCLNPSFPTLTNDDGMPFEAQRTWLQVEALFDPQYEVEFSGGVVFEFSTEKVYAETQSADTSSPWPFDTFGPGNYGVGYYDPVDCDDIDIPCTYIPFPQFDLLADKYAAAGSNGGRPTMSSYTPAAETIPTCPEGFPAVSEFTWPSASVEDSVCWVIDGGFKCPSCGGGTPTTAPPASSPAPSTSMSEMTTSPAQDSTTTTSPEPTTSAPDTTTPEPSISKPDSVTTEPTVEPNQSPSTSPIDWSNIPESSLDGGSSGGGTLSRAVAFCSTLFVLLLGFYV